MRGPPGALRSVEQMISERPKPPQPGWLGLEEISHEVDWQLILHLGDGAARVRVAPGSPAKRVGILSGDYVQSVNGVSLQAFNASPPSAGTVVPVRVHRKPHGTLLFEVMLIDQPAELPLERTDVRRRAPPATLQVACGEPVTRAQRKQWLKKVCAYTALTSTDKALATVLAVDYSNAEGISWRAHVTIARHLGVSVRTVKRSIERLHHCGMLDVNSGKRRGRPNELGIRWPLTPGSNVTFLKGGTDLG